MATIVNSSTTLTIGSFVYLLDASAGNIDVTLPAIEYDYQIFTFVRVDNTANITTIILTTNTLVSSETQFELQGYRNLGLMSLNNVWYPVSGSTNTIR